MLEKELEKETGSKPREKSGEMIINPREEKGSRRKMVTTISKWSHCVHPWSFMVFYQHSSQQEGLFKNISVHVTTLLKKWLPISVTVSLYSVTQGVTWSASSPSDLILSSITSPMLTLFWLHGTSPLRKTQVQSCLGPVHWLFSLPRMFFPHIFSQFTYSVSSFKYFLKYNFFQQGLLFQSLKKFQESWCPFSCPFVLLYVHLVSCLSPVSYL